VFRVCPPAAPQPATEEPADHVASEPGPDAGDDFGPLDDPFALPRVAVTAALATRHDEPRREESGGSKSLSGTLVHRLFERCGTALAPRSDTSSLKDELSRLLQDADAIDADDIDEVLARASDAYLALCRQPALLRALEAGEAMFEVPFSVRPASAQTILRGTFDCLVRRHDGGITILELKTGRPSPEHEQQLFLYLTAARALFPGMPVEGKLVYADGGVGEPGRNLDNRSLDEER
jgi:RecB family exonuclease